MLGTAGSSCPRFHRNGQAEKETEGLVGLAQLAERLGAVAERLRGVALGAELEEITQALRLEAEAHKTGTATEMLQALGKVMEEREELKRELAQQAVKVDSSQKEMQAERSPAGNAQRSGELARLAERLDVVAERLQGVALGSELSEIAQAFRFEAQAQSTGTAAEMLQALGRVSEEREELRRALARQASAAAERELELRLELEQLRERESVILSERDAALSQDRMDEEVMQQQLAVALEEEAIAAREARVDLLADRDFLQKQLESHRKMLRAARVEIVALQKLHGCGTRPIFHVASLSLPEEAGIGRAPLRAEAEPELICRSSRTSSEATIAMSPSPDAVPEAAEESLREAAAAMPLDDHNCNEDHAAAPQPNSISTWRAQRRAGPVTMTDPDVAGTRRTLSFVQRDFTGADTTMAEVNAEPVEALDSTT